MACAMLAIQLDNFLGGEPIQHRHVQGYETPEFMALFPRGVSYKAGVSDSVCCVFFPALNTKKAANKSAGRVVDAAPRSSHRRAVLSRDSGGPRAPGRSTGCIRSKGSATSGPRRWPCPGAASTKATASSSTWER